MILKINKRLILEAKAGPIYESEYYDNSIPCKGIKKKMGFTCKKDKQGFYISTHRARSKSYKSLDKIPLKDINFIDSTR